jgi:alkylation response protein AidB-like acyl-CoA dehydrogenase
LTYLAALLLIAVTGAALGAFAEAWSHARQREKEAELIWVGNQFKQAIGLYYQRSPGSVKRYPEKLEDLLEDKRHLTTQRYLRKIYVDPMTGAADWERISAPEGGIMGVRSASKTISIRAELGALNGNWRFAYEPPTVVGSRQLP